MKYSSRIAPAAIMLLAALPICAAAAPTIDGQLFPGEWDGCYLDTAVTSDLAVDIYGMVEDGHVYVAYVADTSMPGWAAAKWLGINSAFEFKTPQDAVWPERAFSKLDATAIRIGPILAAQSNGSDWADIGTAADNGVESYYHDVMDIFKDHNVAEFKVPIGLVTYAGEDGRLELSGRYWSNQVSTPVYLDLPVGGQDPINVDIDVRPGNSRNRINLGSQGVVPVAILTAGDFDAASVDPVLTTFAGAMPWWFRLCDIDEDGDDDLFLTFRVQQLDLAVGSQEVELTGQTFDDQPIGGSDEVRAFRRGKRQRNSQDSSTWRKSRGG